MSETSGWAKTPFEAELESILRPIREWYSVHLPQMIFDPSTGKLECTYPPEPEFFALVREHYGQVLARRNQMMIEEKERAEVLSSQLTESGDSERRATTTRQRFEAENNRLARIVEGRRELEEALAAVADRDEKLKQAAEELEQVRAASE